MAKMAKEKSLRPHLLVHPNCLPDFDGVPTDNPNCVILGDAVDGFSYQNLNAVSSHLTCGVLQNSFYHTLLFAGL